MIRTLLPPFVSDLISTVFYGSIATVCPDGKPWCSPLCIATDDDLCVYWASWPQNQHSRNVDANGQVFITIYDTQATEGSAIGVYIRAIATPLAGTALERAKQIYTSRFGEDGKHPAFEEGCVRRLYCAYPEEIWVNDEGRELGQFIDVRKLLWKREQNG
jgi:uncharacterized protein YhbP (UPF0306 family)